METLEGLDAGHFIGARHMRARRSECRGHLIDLTYRAAKQLKQETLAAQLHVKLRTLVSWETGTRLPSIGMVILLSLLLTNGLDLSNDLLLAYIADDLVRQAYTQDDDNIRALALHTLEQVSQLQTRKHEQEQGREPHLSLFGNQAEEDHQEHHRDQQGIWHQEPHDEGTTGDPLQQLFAVLETLRTHLELIPVVQDFLREVNDLPVERGEL